MTPDRHLQSAPNLPPPTKGFDIGIMKINAIAATSWGEYAYGLSLAIEAESVLPHVNNRVRGYMDGTNFRERAEEELLSLNNYYVGLHGTKIEVVAHSEVLTEEINGEPKDILVRRFYPVIGEFAGFEFAGPFGICVVITKSGERFRHPLADTEDIWEITKLFT